MVPIAVNAALLPSSLGSRSVRTHHLVVLVIEDVTVPDIAWPFGRVEDKLILSGSHAVDRDLGGRPADGDAGNLAREHLERVFPARLVRIRGDGRALQEGSHIRVAAQGACRVGLVVVVGRAIALDEGARGIGDRTDGAIGQEAGEGATGELRVVERAEAGDIDILPVDQLELDQMDVDGMRILGGVGDLPDFSRTHPRQFGDMKALALLIGLEPGRGVLVPSRKPSQCELLSVTSKGPPGPSTSSRINWRVREGWTPAARVPVAGLASRTIAGSWLRPPRSEPPLAGLKVVSRLERGRLTRNCMTWPSTLGSGGPPLGKGNTAVLTRVKVRPARPAKSMMTSARSLGAMNNCGELGLAGSSSLAGWSSRPPSVPICQMMGPAAFVVESSNCICKKRALQALRKRKR